MASFACATARPAATPFWTSGNALQNVATYGLLTGDTALATSVLINSYDVLVPGYATPKRLNDDIQWHAHAWLRAYELTGNETFLGEVFAIYGELLDPASPWHGWNSTCNGMNWWSTDFYVNSITNGLALTGLARLARVSKSNPVLSGRTVLEWALAIHDGYFSRPGLVKDGAVLDGLDSQCKVFSGGSVSGWRLAFFRDARTRAPCSRPRAPAPDAAWA